MNSLIENFLDFVSYEKGLSKNTQLSYRNDLLKFSNYLTKKKILNLNSLNRNDIRNYLLKNEAQISDFIPLNKNLYKDNNFKFPLDICLLGIGNDGHFASLFPNMINNTNTLDPKSKLNIIEINANGDPFLPRISMNLPLILSSKLIILIIKGKMKQEVLRDAYTNKNIPLHYLLHNRKNNLHIELLND